MIDGGVLDNKPFSAVAKLIEGKPANRRVYRVLMYIEPDPSLTIEPPPADMPRPRHLPGLLYGLFRHEPVHADLQAVASRNRLVERLVAIAEAAEADAARVMLRELDPIPDNAGDFDTLRQTVNHRLTAGYNPAYPGYTMLKAKRAADSLANFLSDALGYPYESKHGYFVRELVRSWLTQCGALDPPTLDEDAMQYQSKPSQRDLLGAFDVPYRLRRLRNIVRVANRLYEDDSHETAQVDDLKRRLMSVEFAFNQLTEGAAEYAEQIRTHLQDEMNTTDLDRFIRGCEGQPSKIADGGAPQLDGLYATLRCHFQETMDNQGAQLRELIAKLPDGLRAPIARAYLLYPMIDLAIFPLMDCAGIGDLTTTRVVRVSPHDAKALSADPHRLKSREIGAFAGFLRKGARQHDLLWGRLDGAERLIDQIIAAAGGNRNDTRVEALRTRALIDATDAILSDFTPEESPELCELIPTLRTKLQLLRADA